MGADIIVVAQNPRGLPGPVHHLMRQLLLDRQILWVDDEAFRGLDDEADHALGPPAGDAPGETPPFPVLSATALGAGRHPLARFVTSAMLARRIDRAARLHGLRQPILWLSGTAGKHLLPAPRGSYVVYQPVSRQREPGADALERAADLIVAPTPETAAGFPSGKTRVLPLGVDVDLFTTPCQRAVGMPVDGPVAGYHGRVDDDFDVALLAETARRLPRWRFVVIGPVSTDVGALHDLQNVLLPGQLPHDELPRFSQYWSAALIPRRAPAAAHLPVHLGEYLAAGLPVLTSGPVMAGPYSDMVEPVADAGQMVQALDAARDEPPARRARRRARVMQDAWSARAGLVNRLLDRLTLGQPPVITAASPSRARQP